VLNAEARHADGGVDVQIRVGGELLDEALGIGVALSHRDVALAQMV